MSGDANDAIRQAKRDTRQLVRARIAAMSPEERARASGAACRVVASDVRFRAARAVLLYMPLHDEIDARPLLPAALGAGARVFLPRVDWDRATMEAVEIDAPEFPTRVGRHDLREPAGESTIDPARLDLIIVPGVAFDARGNRLGRGKGFYDRFLARAGSVRSTDSPDPRPFRLALCFACQIVDRIATDEHDERVDAIASESGLVVC